jgi:predicted O-linked N-acetylglucosamine transferase (SPINDLY family)
MATMSIQQALGLAVQRQQAGRLADAEHLCRQILARDAENPEAIHLLGTVAAQAGKSDIAVELIGRAIRLKPRWAEAHGNLGNVLVLQRRFHDAVEAYRLAIDIRGNPHLYYNLANALREMGHIAEAIAAYRQSIALDPEFIDPRINLGIALAGAGELDEARAVLASAIEKRPDSAAAHNTFGNILKETGELEEAIASYRRAIHLKRDFSLAHSNLLLDLHYHPKVDAETIASEHRQWNEQHAEPLKNLIRPHGNDRDPDRRLRIGYVSPDFRDHVVGRFVLPMLANHDAAKVEVFAYAQVPVLDEMSRRLQSHTHVWRSLVGLSDIEAANLIREDRIDILVDLAGHTANNRLLVFAQKPAPVQMTYLGYPDSTGLSAMDYRLTDAFADPPGETDKYHSEKLIRLASCAWCYEPIIRAPLPSQREGRITFGSFNAFAKITEPMLRQWAKILLAVPDSRLLLKAGALSSAAVRGRVEKVMRDSGVDPCRLDFRGRDRDRSDHLQRYGEMDIALDTFPYHGTATTCEALWMGVPVVTLAGAMHVSRVGVSLLSNVDLPELVAKSPDEYVRLAVELANDRPRLRGLSSTLRERMEASALMDGARLAREIEAAYRTMWREWCANGVI